MLSRIIALFHRYADHHLSRTAEATMIPAPDGSAAGWLDRIELRDGQLRLQGRACEGPVVLSLAGHEVRTDLPRGGGAFELSVPAGPGRARLRLGQAAELTLRRPRPGWQRAWLLGRFFLTMALLLPALAGWGLTRDPRYRKQVKHRLGLARVAAGLPLAPGPLHATPAPDRPDGDITIVLPVYNARDVLGECLERVARHTDLAWRLVAVEDGSDDPQVRELLRDWAARMNEQAPGRVRLIEHGENLGFVAAANAGLAAALEQGDGPVVILNSDALVPEGWASRLVAPLREDPALASVTPMSNDAEIFSVPVICAARALREGQGDAIDAQARRLSPHLSRAIAPTGVGYCMAMSRRFLHEVGLFDPDFGRGYGEEVDWCQKARARGGRHLGLASLFVEHRGGASFGASDKHEMILANNRIISRRYPAYDGEVQKFLREDPLLSARLALGLAWAGSLGQAVPVYLAHSLGGGADHWLSARIAADPGPAVVLRVGGEAPWQLELHVDGAMIAGHGDDLEMILALLEPLRRRRVVYSCGVGAADPLGLPELLLRLASGADDRLEVLVHDYLPISPSYTLLDPDGGFRGPVLADGSARAARHRTRGPDGRVTELADWQAAWGRMLHKADEVRVFSRASRDLMLAVWPELADRLRLAPHRLLQQVPPVPAPPPDAPPVLGVLGNLAPHKGAALTCELARRLQRSGRAGLVLLGEIHPDYALPRGAIAHGPYRVREIPDLVARYGITHWLIPSVWPETFSFATHEALATGLPVLAFDIGAQGDAVAAAANGHAVAYDPDADLPARIEAALARLIDGAAS